MFRYLVDHPGEPVSNVAARMGIAVATASVYLRALNARGLLRADRSGPWVRYSVEPDPTIPESAGLVSALRAELRSGDRTVDPVFHILTAFTHPRRLLVLRVLAETGGLTRPAMRRQTGMPEDALARHLDKLVRRGFATVDNGTVFPATPPGPLARTLLYIAAGKATS